jgi:hypothetical protein
MIAFADFFDPSDCPKSGDERSCLTGSHREIRFKPCVPERLFNRPTAAHLWLQELLHEIPTDQAKILRTPIK